MKIDAFQHIQSAHCENGVTSNLLRHSGIDRITEPLAFGIGSGLFFFYLPFIKINNGPFITFRTMPGLIFKRTCDALGIPFVRKKFSSPASAKAYLDKQLEAGQPVGCQVGVYYLIYFPKEYRFHFNAHNLVVFGKEDGRYLISDPVMEAVTSLSEYELERVRFAKGPLAPKGQLYYPQRVNGISDEQIRRAIKKGVSRNVNHMLRIPSSWGGVKGIRFTAKRIRTWREKLGLQTAGLYLAQLVRMQEEIGTGGGGFRFIYAAFLQQAQPYFPGENLQPISEQFTKAGDMWRTVAVQSAGIYKGRLTEQKDFDVIADHMLEIAEVEKQAFVALSKLKWKT